MAPTDPPVAAPAPRVPRRKREVPQLDLWSGQSPAADQSAPGSLSPAPSHSQPLPTTEVQAQRGSGAASGPATTPASHRFPRSPATTGDVALTRRQEHLLEHLRARAANGARPPTLAELCAELGLASRGSLHKQVTALIEAGLVEPMLGKQRGVRLRRPAAVKESRLPLLGRIDGSGLLHPLGRYEAMTVPTWLGPDAEGFLLTVEGVRWAHLGIHAGDLLVIAACATPAESDMVAILIDEQEYVLGRLRHDAEVLVIETDAPPAPTRRVMATRASVQGVVRGLMRRLHHG